MGGGRERGREDTATRGRTSSRSREPDPHPATPRPPLRPTGTSSGSGSSAQTGPPRTWSASRGPRTGRRAMGGGGPRKQRGAHHGDSKEISWFLGCAPQRAKSCPHRHSARAHGPCLKVVLFGETEVNPSDLKHITKLVGCRGGLGVVIMAHTSSYSPPGHDLGAVKKRLKYRPQVGLVGPSRSIQ